MSTDPLERTDLEIAEHHEAAALRAFQTACETATAAKHEVTRLQAALDNASSAEKAAAELAQPTAAFTQAVSDATAAVRVKEYRAAKLARDEEEARKTWLDRQQTTAVFALAESSKELGLAADDLDAAVAVVIAKDAEYRDKLAVRRQRGIMAGRKDYDDLRDANVLRVMYSFYATRILRREIYSNGRDCQGKALQSAADISRETGEHYFPLIRG